MAAWEEKEEEGSREQMLPDDGDEEVEDGGLTPARAPVLPSTRRGRRMRQLGFATAGLLALTALGAVAWHSTIGRGLVQGAVQWWALPTTVREADESVQGMIDAVKDQVPAQLALIGWKVNLGPYRATTYCGDSLSYTVQVDVGDEALSLELLLRSGEVVALVGAFMVRPPEDICTGLPVAAPLPDYAAQIPQQMTAQAATGVCRFGPTYTSDDLLSNTAAQDKYVTDMLTWDGKFGSPGYGMSQLGLTCDHCDLQPDGTPIKKGECGASYTAASKESLHIGMLALVVNRTRLAWHWMAGAPSESAAVSTAVDRLTSIIGAYEAFIKRYPGLGGFLPWVTVTSQGFELSQTTNVMVPALDNGQLAFAMLAASQALKQVGQPALAGRYRAYVTAMGKAVNLLWLWDDGKAGSTSQVKDALQPVSKSNRVLTGKSSYPFEGELMIFFQDLYGSWSSTSDKQQLWLPVRYYTRQTKDLTGSSLPNGPITVQEGWRFSAHEMWKYMILPYFDYAMARRVFMNGERARTWNSHMQSIPGLLASCYDEKHKYHDNYGTLPLSMGYTPPSASDLMVTPYAAFPTTLADRGHGLAWHRAMVSRPEMQSVLGSVESSQAIKTEPQVAQTTSWDTKVTMNIAALGGTSDLLRAALQADGKYDRFIEVVKFNYNAWNTIHLKGESTPFAPPPGLAASDNVPSARPDFPTCGRTQEG